ncbi:unnamed protein product [Owenia fusiformis]|uniref:Uncharacterized protein n=1 Tax=Owenia fusiformis TaxID=6347 RepID=A0A8J1XG97_OWEFU|nr:unnamed protein product [Owenia fusiformis]
MPKVCSLTKLVYILFTCLVYFIYENSKAKFNKENISAPNAQDIRCQTRGRFSLVPLWRHKGQRIDGVGYGCQYIPEDDTGKSFEDDGDINTILYGYSKNVRDVLIANKINPTQWLDAVRNTYSSAREYEINATKVVCNESRNTCMKAVEAIETNNQHFQIPFSEFFKSFNELQQMPFFKDLKTILQSLPISQIHTLGISANYIPSLLNWILISKKYTVPPIDHILVYSLDSEFCKIVDEKGFDIHCIVVNLRQVVKPVPRQRGFENKSLMWMVRLLIWRICNYLGYDVISFDADALPIRNPGSLFHKFPDADIMAGQTAFYPTYIQAYWKMKTLNMGTVLLRASLNSSQFWEILSAFSDQQLESLRIDDQKLINEVIVCLGVRWDFPPLWLTYTNMARDPIIRENEEMMLGRELIQGHASSLKVIGIPGLLFCRRTCFLDRLQEIYVWHSCVKDKKGEIWLLNDDWEEKILYLPNVSKMKVTDDAWMTSLINSTVFEKLPVPCS